MPLQHAYRPKAFDEVRGNEDPVAALEAAVTRDEADRPHVILVTGPAGTGKTTLARIVRDTLDCDDANYRVIEPGQGGVEFVRELKRTVRLKPMGGCPVRIWHIEECHRITGPAREDLLTLLEEPPAHAYFTLCTTQPEQLFRKKSDEAFKRRCHMTELRPIGDHDMNGLLNDVWSAEVESNDDIPKDLFQVIVDNAHGSPGMALKLLDEVIDLEPDRMAAAVERKSQEKLDAFALCKLLVYGKAPWSKVRPVLAKLKEQGDDAEGLRRLMLRASGNYLLKKDAGQAGLVNGYLRAENTFDTGWDGFVGVIYDIVLGE